MDYIPVLAIPIAALAIYLPVVIVPYAFLDDYSILGAQHGLGGDLWKLATQGGRPIQGLFLTGAFSLVPDIDSLRLVRLLSLLGTALLGLLLYHALRKGGFHRWLSAGVSVSVISLPCFQVYVSWAVLSEAPYAAILAGLASLRASSAFDLCSRPALLLRAEATGLFLCALLTYQPAAMFFWVFTAIDVLRPSEPLGRATRKLAASLGVGIVAMALGFAVVKVAQYFYGPLEAGRSSLTHDLVGKLRWFVDEPLVNALSLFEVTPTPRLAEGMAILLIAGILLLHIDKGRNALGFLGISVLFVPLSYLPNLAIEENWASYRSLGALSALLALYTWLGLWGVARVALTISARSRAGLMGARIVVVELAAHLSFLSLAVILIPLWHFPDPSTVSGALAGSPRLAAFALLFAIFAGLGLWVTSRSFQSSERAAPKIATTGICYVAATLLALTGILVAARNVTSLFVQPQSVELQMLRSAINGSDGFPERVVFIRPNWSHGAAPIVRYDEFGFPSTFATWVPDPAVFLVLREKHPTARPVVENLPWHSKAPPTSSEPGVLVVDMRDLQDRRVDWTFWSLHSATTLPVPRALLRDVAAHARPPDPVRGE